MSLDIYLTGLKLYIGKAGLELAAIFSSLPSAVTTGMCHQSWQCYLGQVLCKHQLFDGLEMNINGKLFLWFTGNQMCYVDVQTTSSCFPLTPTCQKDPVGSL